jgi:transcription elongation factor Elf1
LRLCLGFDNCEKEFLTVYGLDLHLMKAHGEHGVEKSKIECPFCGKRTVYIDQHINAVHKEFKCNNICKVCKQKYQVYYEKAQTCVYLLSVLCVSK